MKLFFFTHCLLLLTFTQHAASAPGKGAALTLEEVTRAVQASNPSIKAAFLRWNASKARVVQSGAWDDLRVSFEERLQRFVSVSPNAFTDQMLTVEQMVPLSGKNRARARAAAAEALASYEEVRRQELETMAKARAAYFRMANAQAQLELNRQDLVSLEQLAHVSQSHYESGQQSGAEVLRAQTEWSRMMETTRDLQLKLAVEQSQLNVLMNRDAFAPLGVPAEVPVEAGELSEKNLRALILARRPEVRKAANQLAAEKARLQLAHRAWVPDPALSVKVQRYNNAAQTISEVDAGISFDVPWLNYGKYAAQTREAASNVAAAEQDWLAAQAEAIGLLREQLEKIVTAHHHVELLRDKVLPQAQQSAQASQLSYQAGRGTLMELIATQRTVREIESMSRQDLADYQVAVAELEAIVGTSLFYISSKKTPQP